MTLQGSIRALSQPKKLYNKSHFEAGRRPKNRSSLCTNEDFEGKPNAKRALFDNYFKAGNRYFHTKLISACISPILAVIAITAFWSGITIIY